MIAYDSSCAVNAIKATEERRNAMNANKNWIQDGTAVPEAGKRLTDEQVRKVKECFEKLNPGQLECRVNGTAGSLERRLIWLLRRYIMGSGANILYCLSIMAILYGVCGMIGPVLEKSEFLFRKLACIGAMSLYEIGLFGVLSLIILLKKGLDDAVSLSIYAALFIVGTATGISTISNDNYQISLGVGFACALLAAGKIFLMHNNFKMFFDKWIMSGTFIFFAWNFFISSLMAYLLLESIVPKEALRVVWLGGWIAMLAGGAAIFASALFTPDGETLEQDKSKPFVLSKGMIWIFSAFLLSAGLVHQIAIAYVFEIKYVFGDFIPFIILFSVLSIEILRNYGKKTGITEILLSMVPFSAIVLAILNKEIFAKSRLDTSLIELLWTPTALFLISGMAFLLVFLRRRNKWFALTAAPYFIGMLVMAGAIPSHPQDLNWAMIGSIVVPVLIGLGLYYKKIFLSVTGLLLAAIGIGMPDRIVSLVGHWGLAVPGVNFLVAGLGLILLALYFKDRFPMFLSAIGALFIFLGSFAAYRGTFENQYTMIFSVIFLLLAGVFWMRIKHLPVTIMLLGSEIRGIYFILSGFTYWHYVALSFLLLGCGAMLSIFRKPKNELPPEEAKSNTGKGLNRKLSLMEVLAILFIFFVLLGMLVPTCNGGSREKARRINCTNNLKQIGLAIRMYSQDNNENFPPYDGVKGLEMLRAGGYLENVKMYTCPSTTNVIPDNTEITEENCSYHYRGGLNESKSVDTAIAWDKETNHVKYGNILFLDGHAQGYAGANWLEKTK